MRDIQKVIDVAQQAVLLQTIKVGDVVYTDENLKILESRPHRTRLVPPC